MADWQLPLREVHFADLLLPEVQESRQFIRMLYGRARIQIARGDFDGAIVTMQMVLLWGGILPRPHVVISLVGYFAIDTMLNASHEMFAQPCAPNLYWAWMIADSLIDLRQGLSGERYMLLLHGERLVAPRTVAR